MVEVVVTDTETRITLSPNRSLNWQQTRWIMLAFGGFCLSIAVAWTIVGAWLILPFAGLEVSLLALVMYLVCRRTYQVETLVVGEHQVFLSQTEALDVAFNRSQLRLTTYRVNHPEDVQELYLSDASARRRIGDFLNLDDQKKLLEQLIAHSIYPKEMKPSVQLSC